MKLTHETRVTTPDGFLTYDALVELTGGYLSKKGQEKILAEQGIKFKPGKTVIYVRAEDVFGGSHEPIKTQEQVDQEPDFSILGVDDGKSKRPSLARANAAKK